jgi:hypothetical protein
MTATDPIVTIERAGGFEYRVDTSAADRLTTEQVEAYRAQRIRSRTAALAADWMFAVQFGDRKSAECVCPKRNWYKKYGNAGKWVYEFNEVEPGVWSVRPVGRVVKRSE